MELIFAAAFCSVLVSILLKIAKTKGYQPLYMISWNYLTASLLCYFWFQPDFSHISWGQTPWWLIVILGITLPTIFGCLAKSLQTAGILKTEIAQRLSVILSLIAAYFLFQEHFNVLKIFGIFLGMLAIFSILYAHREHTQAGWQGVIYLALVWFGYAVVDILLKYVTGLGLQFTVALNLIFICAFIVSLGYNLIRHQTWGGGKNIVAGLGLGILNFANIALYVKAHIVLQDSPALVFAGMNILVVVFGVLAGIVLFREQLKLSSVFGLALAMTSVFCLAFAM